MSESSQSLVLIKRLRHRAKHILRSKYIITESYINTRAIEHFILNKRTHQNIVFQEMRISNEPKENLKKFYLFKRVRRSLRKLVDFYQINSVIFPNLWKLYESKYLYRGMAYKQLIIDNQEKLKYHMELKENFNTDEEDNMIFSPDVFEDIMKEDPKFYIKHDHKENILVEEKKDDESLKRIDSLERLIMFINFTEINAINKIDNSVNINKTIVKQTSFTATYLKTNDSKDNMDSISDFLNSTSDINNINKLTDNIKSITKPTSISILNFNVKDKSKFKLTEDFFKNQKERKAAKKQKLNILRETLMKHEENQFKLTPLSKVSQLTLYQQLKKSGALKLNIDFTTGYKLKSSSNSNNQVLPKVNSKVSLSNVLISLHTPKENKMPLIKVSSKMIQTNSTSNEKKYNSVSNLKTYSLNKDNKTPKEKYSSNFGNELTNTSINNSTQGIDTPVYKTQKISGKIKFKFVSSNSVTGNKI